MANENHSPVLLLFSVQSPEIVTAHAGACGARGQWEGSSWALLGMSAVQGSELTGKFTPPISDQIPCPVTQSLQADTSAS